MNRNYQYGIKPPITNAELVRTAILRGHQYRNKLTEIHQKYPNPIRAWKIAYDAEVDLAYADVCKRHKPPPKATKADMDARKKVVNAEMRVLRAEIRARMAPPEEAPEVKEARCAQLGVETRDSRAKCDVFWGTYLLSEQAAEKAQQFRRWDGDGQIGVQIQKGMYATELDKHSFVQIVPMPEQPGKAFPLTARWSLLRLRIGTVPGSIRPIWAEFPIRLHRTIPPLAQIMAVNVRRELRGDSQHWTATFVLRGPSEAFCPVELSEKESHVGIDLGWRRMPNGRVRVAYWYGSDDKEGSVEMPAEMIDTLARYEAGRKLHFNAHQERLVAWLTGLGLSHVGLWQSMDRFAKALLDRDPPDELRAWRTQDRHLANAIAGMWRQIECRRKARYGEIAAMLARRYQTIKAEECNLSDLRRERFGEGRDATASRRLAALVAPGKFRTHLKDGAEMHRSAYSLVPCADTTRTCADCGHLNTWEDQSPLMLTCAGCASMWDQDRNAARVIASASVTPTTVPKKSDGLSERQLRFRKNRSQVSVEVSEDTTGIS